MLRRFGLVSLGALLFAMVLGVGPAAAQGKVTIQLNTQNNSGESGTATLTPMGNQTQVVLNITGAPAGVPQPAHIHTGTCANLGGVKYPLTNVVDGKSTTMVNVKLSDIQTGSFAINVHKSAPEIAVYVACGDIPAASASANAGAATPSSAPSTGSGGGSRGSDVALWSAVVAAAAAGAGLAVRRRASRSR